MKKAKILMIFLVIGLIVGLFVGCIPTIPTNSSDLEGEGNGKAELIEKLRKGFELEPAYCAQCGKVVQPKLGDIRRPHFAHLDGDAQYCYEHREEDPKKQVPHYRWEKYFEAMFLNHDYKVVLQKGKRTLDGPCDSIIPDLLVENGNQQIGFEVQLSNISDEKLQAKIEGYHSLNLDVFYFTPNKNVFKRCKEMKIPGVLSTIETAPEDYKATFDVLDSMGKKRKSNRIPKMLFESDLPKPVAVQAVGTSVTEDEEDDNSVDRAYNWAILWAWGVFVFAGIILYLLCRRGKGVKRYRLKRYSRSGMFI